MAAKLDAIYLEARAFAQTYGAFWAFPPDLRSENITALGEKAASYYRPGVTFFTNGNIARFETQAQAADLIATELRSAVAAGMGAHLALHPEATRIEPYSMTAAVCWLTFTFRPAADGPFAGKDWTFTNIYGYRAGKEGSKAGWEYVVRDQEDSEMRRVTGFGF